MLPKNNTQDSVSLPAAYGLLNGYINSSISNFRSLEQGLKDSVSLLNEQLKSLFAQEEHRHLGGLISNYYARKDREEGVSPPAQQDLINEAIQMDKVTRQSTIGILIQVEENISRLLKQESKIPEHLRKVLEQVHSSIQSTQKNLKTMPPLETVVNANPIYMLSQRLNVPFNLILQSMDPFADEKNEGYCYGHLMMWRDSVTSNPTPSYMPHWLTPSAYQHQETLSSVSALITGFKDVFSMSEIKEATVSQYGTIRGAVQALIFMLSSDHDHVYEFDLYSYDADTKTKNHAMGIRKLPNKRGYELFDPNNGIFVFQNAFQLEKWLTYLVRNFTDNNISGKQCKLELRPIGKQPPNAVASLPILQRTQQPESKLLWSLSELSSYPHNKKVAVLMHHANMFSLTEIAAEEAQTMQIALYRYFLKPEITFGENEFKQSIELESKELKNPILRKIDAEIQRLPLIKDNEMMRKGLNDLKNEISQAAPTQNLSTIVNQWWASGSPHTNSEIFGRTDTRFFINELEEKNEISPYCLNVMRACVIEQLRHMIFDCSWNRLPAQPGIDSLKEAYSGFQKGQLTLQGLLIQMKKIAANNTSFLGRYASAGNSSLVECLREIRPDDAYSLKCHLYKLQNFDKNFLVALGQAPQPKNMQQRGLS